MEVFEAIFGRRSVRKYETRRVPDDLVEKLLEAARWSPSGGNTQPWRFVVVRDEVTKKMLRAVSPGLSGKPSVIIVVCVDFGTKPDETETIKILGIGATVQNLLIAAHALGLGACWVGSTNWRGVKETVGIPKHSLIDPVSLVSIGYPAETPKPRARQPVEEVTFFERFETAWNKSVSGVNINGNLQN